MSLQRVMQQVVGRASLVRSTCSNLSSPACRNFTTSLPFRALQAQRTSMTAPLANWELARQYNDLPFWERATFVPKTRGSITDHKSFLTAIGRGCESYAEKFRDWEHLFKATAEEMESDLGVKCAQRKYILGWREWYKRGIDLYEVAIPKRQKKYLKAKAKVQLARLKRQGLA